MERERGPWTSDWESAPAQLGTVTNKISCIWRDQLKLESCCSVLILPRLTKLHLRACVDGCNPAQNIVTLLQRRFWIRNKKFKILFCISADWNIMLVLLCLSCIWEIHSSDGILTNFHLFPETLHAYFKMCQKCRYLIHGW